MAQSLFSFHNAFDSATSLSASPSLVSTLPASNLQTLSRAKVARTTSTTSQQITGTWASAQTVNMGALIGHNLTTSGTWRLQLYSDTGLSSQVYDSGSVSAYPGALASVDSADDTIAIASAYRRARIAAAYFATLTTVRGFKLTLADASNPAGYMEAAQVWIGAYESISNDPAYGMELGWNDDGEQVRSAAGTIYSESRTPYRRLTFDFNALSDADRAIWLAAQRHCARRLPLFVSLYPGATGAKTRDHTMLGKFTKLAGVSKYVPSYCKLQVTIDEC